MQTDHLSQLLEAYHNAPAEFRATRYWQSYEINLLKKFSAIDISRMRSGEYLLLATFGFNDVVYTYHPSLPAWVRIPLKFFHKHVIKNRAILPYGLNISKIREMAFRHCELLGSIVGAAPISSIEMSAFGAPEDLFRIKGKQYSVAFLGYYIRYCFAHKHVSFQGDEIVVELGSGSGHQIELLKKLYPKLTVFCFDLPAQIFLCEKYLSGALDNNALVSSQETLTWTDLSNYKRGYVHFFGNWQWPLLKNFKFDVFWNAASFGEMERNVVINYLSYIRTNAKWVYLLQARHGKETKGSIRVNKKISLQDYISLLPEYTLVEEEDAYEAQGRRAQSDDYFEGLWRRTELP